MKRLVDLYLSSILLAAFAPLILIISIAVVVESGSPVFFSQRRIGRYGRGFRILKFRTMVPDSERLGRLTVADDRRVTRVGHYLRQYKLDELPQLINVLFGHMSLVGPRPEVEEFLEHYSDRDREIILSVRPGITDSAAIEFRSEQALLSMAEDPEKTYVEEILPRKIALYKDYVANATVRRDLTLLWRTVWTLWIRRRTPRVI